MFLKAVPLGVNLSLNLRCKAFTEVLNEKAKWITAWQKQENISNILVSCEPES